jgi:hypothetical protein
MRFSLRDVFWLALLVYLACASANECRSGEPEEMWRFTHNPPINGRKLTPKPWEQVVGQRVVGEGLAWGSANKGFGEYVILDRAIVYVPNSGFLKADADGRTIRIRGKLSSRTIKAAPPNAQGTSRDVTIFEIVDAKWEFIDRVEWPWLREAE